MDFLDTYEIHSVAVAATGEGKCYFLREKELFIDLRIKLSQMNLNHVLLVLLFKMIHSSKEIQLMAKRQIVLKIPTVSYQEDILFGNAKIPPQVEDF